MNLVCLDLEGVLVPEIWIAVAKASGVSDLMITTREEPDYDRLMKTRIQILKDHHLTIYDIQEIIVTMSPLEGAKGFLDEIRDESQVIIISDTFYQFAKPLMEDLERPTLFCNKLIIDVDGVIVGYETRCPDTKLTTVRALQSCGFETIAAGDSLNDIAMIRASKAGFLFRTTEAIKKANPDIPSYVDYGDLAVAIEDALSEDEETDEWRMLE